MRSEQTEPQCIKMSQTLFNWNEFLVVNCITEALLECKEFQIWRQKILLVWVQAKKQPTTLLPRYLLCPQWSKYSGMRLANVYLFVFDINLFICLVYLQSIKYVNLQLLCNSFLVSTDWLIDQIIYTVWWNIFGLPVVLTVCSQTQQLCNPTKVIYVFQF